MIARDELHAILDAVPEERLSAAAEALADLANPVLLALIGVPEDDEPVTGEDRQALAEGRAGREHGRTVSLGAYVAQA